MKNSTDIIYGIHAVQAALEHAPETITSLYVQAERHDQKMANILNQANTAAIRIQYLSAAELNRRYPQINHQGIIAQCKSQKLFQEQDLDNILNEINGTPLLLILDGVQDPHNLGACLRTANAAGVHAVIAPKDRAASLTPTVRKVASGAAETTPFISVTNLSRTLRLLKDRGIWMFGLAGEATETLYSVDLRVPTGLVLGAEGEGMRRLTREHCDQLLSIPMAGSVSSLNVSVAAGICLYEVIRQRLIIK